MRIKQIELKISENTKLVKELQSQVAKLSRENSYLVSSKKSRLLQYFIEYIEVGSIYTFKKWANLNGIQIGLKEGETSDSSYFSEGDQIEFVKKNKVSFVIKCTQKFSVSFGKNYGKLKEVKNANTLFRVEINTLFDYLLRDSDFKLAFDTFVTRKESLDLLGI